MDALIVDGKKGEQVYTLQGADDSYRVLMETMNEGAATLNGDGTILYGNGRLASLLKKSLHDLIGSFFQQYVAPAASRTFMKLLKQGRKGRGSREIALQCADGRSIPVQISLSPVDMGETKVVSLVATDLTDLKQAEKALRHANDVLEERVRERTVKLSRANASLRTEIRERRKTEEELRRLNRTLKARSRSDQAMMFAVDELKYMEEVCKIVVEDCGHAMVWIGFAEKDEAKTVRPIAYAGFEEGYLETLRITWADTERGRGPTGTAIRTGKFSMCKNMLTNPAVRAMARRGAEARLCLLPRSSSDGRREGLRRHHHLLKRVGFIFGR